MKYQGYFNTVKTVFVLFFAKSSYQKKCIKTLIIQESSTCSIQTPKIMLSKTKISSAAFTKCVASEKIKFYLVQFKLRIIEESICIC